MRPTVAVTRASSSTRAILRTSRGIPQGDPLSSLTFTAVLARPLATMADMHDAHVTPLAFADDTLLVCGRDHVTPVVRQWEHLLSAHSLTLNHGKLSIWLPECARPPDELRRAFPEASFSPSGIVICGLPTASSSSAHDPDALLPWGTQAFTLAHLETLKASLLRRFQALSQLTELLGPTTSACHLALHVARINLQARFVHIWRYLPWPVLHIWAWSLQRHWQDWLATLLSLPLDCPTASSLLALPVRHCGLGLLDVRHEAVLHYLPGALALCDQASSLAVLLDVPLHLTMAATHVQTTSGISVEALYHAHVPHRRAKALRDAFYAALARRLAPAIPWLHAPVLTPGPDASTLRSFQTRVAMAPYLASPHTFLSRPALRLWIANHLGLPVFASEQRCTYIP